MAFSLQIKTAQDKADEALAARTAQVNAECTRRIYAVVDQYAQSNLTGAAAAGLLAQADFDTYKLGLAWIADMRAACDPLYADATLDPAADAHWPAVPAGVAELAALY